MQMLSQALRRHRAVQLPRQQVWRVLNLKIYVLDSLVKAVHANPRLSHRLLTAGAIRLWTRIQA
jgi:hypothetical protein